MFPDCNHHYKNVSYWNNRYSSEDSKDWLLTYDSLKTLLHEFIKPSHKILMLGCGNSLLSEQLALEGFEEITNIDYSPVVISKMQDHCETCRKLKWMEMDARHLLFESEVFDVVLEKATIDCLLVDEKDMWNISPQNSALIQDVLLEVSRVLKPGGHFMSISFSQPHFRGPLYARKVYNWSFDAVELGQDFHHYAYIMTKDRELQPHNFFTYIPPTSVINENRHVFPESDADSDFLSKIEI